MPKINVLIFPAGEINSIELHDSLSTCVNVNLYGASSIDRHGEYIFKNYISGLPMITDSDFINKFNKILQEKHIDLIFPTHDTVVEYLVSNSDKIKAKIVCADRKTAEICRDKKKLYELFKCYNFCPDIYTDFKNLPVFIKPRKGQGSVGAKIIKNIEDVPCNINIDEYVICEYLPGEEYTVDCLSDKDGKLRAVLPRVRKRILAGVCVSGQNEKLTEEIYEIADKINSALDFKGLWYFR